MIGPEPFIRVLQGLQALRPMAKPLPEAALLLAWQSFPEQAKADLGEVDLEWAAAQYLQDPAPPRELAPHIALLRYLYVSRDGQARPENGRRPGSLERPDHWLPFDRRPEAQAPALPAAPLPPPEPLLPPLWHPGLQQIGAGIGAVLARGVAAGRWSLKALDRQPAWWKDRPAGSPPWRNLAREWIDQNPQQWAALQDAHSGGQSGAVSKGQEAAA